MRNQISSDLCGLQCFRLPCPSTYNVFLCNVSSLRRENNFQENTALQIYSYHHYIIVYVIIALTIIKGYFRMKWSSTVWRTISSTGMVRQNNIQKSMNCGFIHHDGRLLIKNLLLHILIGTFMSAVVGRFPAILVSIVVITSIAFAMVLFFAFVVVFALRELHSYTAWFF